MKKLNDIGAKDQLIRKYTNLLSRKLEFDSIQNINKYNVISELDFENIADLHQISNKRGIYPSGKSFALIQRSFGISEIHNLKSKDNFDFSIMRK